MRRTCASEALPAARSLRGITGSALAMAVTLSCQPLPCLLICVVRCPMRDAGGRFITFEQLYKSELRHAEIRRMSPYGRTLL